MIQNVWSNIQRETRWKSIVAAAVGVRRPLQLDWEMAGERREGCSKEEKQVAASSSSVVQSLVREDETPSVEAEQNASSGG